MMKTVFTISHSNHELAAIVALPGQQGKGNNVDSARLRDIVMECLRRELRSGKEIPGEEEDLVDCGALDSMGWVSVLRDVEAATGVRDPSELFDEGPRSIAAVLAGLETHLSAGREGAQQPAGRPSPRAAAGQQSPARVTGWAHSVGGRTVPIAEVEREFNLPAGKLGRGAGMVSVARLREDESLAEVCARVAQKALAASGLHAGELDCLVATSETHVGYPALAATLHAELMAREACAAFDVGGACAGMLYALRVAKSLIESGAARNVLVVAGEMHSRILTPGRVPGEFGGLFGDGASAFVARAAAEIPDGTSAFEVGEFLFGSSAAYSRAIRIGLDGGLGFALEFQGEALARAAVERLQSVVEDLELLSGVKREEMAALAMHQPNPRLVELFARQTRIPLERIPMVARTNGNLGSSTCGAALSMALKAIAARPAAERGPVFIASVGPGLHWAGTTLRPAG
jgi:3-oxoacyl-[acyl-carrier-protein] synthase-3